MLKTINDILPLVTSLGALGGGGFALWTYWRTAKTKRAEWLYNLHAKFYESGNYKHIRRVLDYEPHPEFGHLEKGLAGGGKDDLVEELVDYLNFFECVAGLWKLNQLKLDEISMLFEYYILRLRDHDFLIAFIRENGFENLSDLIERLASSRKKGQ
jgi:hypothetical protein